MSDREYVCPQCGPDSAGADAHAERYHTITFGADPEVAALRQALDALCTAAETVEEGTDHESGSSALLVEVLALKALRSAATAARQTLQGETG